MQIKTIVADNAPDFDREVNKYLNKMGWSFLVNPTIHSVAIAGSGGSGWSSYGHTQSCYSAVLKYHDSNDSSDD